MATGLVLWQLVVFRSAKENRRNKKIVETRIDRISFCMVSSIRAGHRSDPPLSSLLLLRIYPPHGAVP